MANRQLPGTTHAIDVEFRNFRPCVGKTPPSPSTCPFDVEEGEKPAACTARQSLIDSGTSKNIRLHGNAADKDCFDFDLAVGDAGGDSSRMQIADPEIVIDRGARYQDVLLFVTSSPMVLITTVAGLLLVGLAAWFLTGLRDRRRPA